MGVLCTSKPCMCRPGAKERNDAMQFRSPHTPPPGDGAQAAPRGALPKKLVWLIPVVVIALLLILDSFYTLKEDQYAVITTFGKPTTVSASGLQPKIPLIQHVTKVSKSIQGFPLGYRSDSSAEVEAESLMITYDYNFVNVDFYVEYRVTRRTPWAY